ncbi:MAG: type IV pilus twitching motility protein PilT [Myxococcota bacterium]|nr:type IV pilus twitching motility protein PilT [Myxococcota bacterium]
MKRIDFYVQHLVRHNATGVVLTSGEPVLFQFPTGERKSNTPIEHAQVSQLVQEAAPPTAIEALRSSGRGAFEHTASSGTTVQVSLEAKGPRQWVVTLEPKGAGAAKARPAAAVGIATPQDEAAAVRQQPEPPPPQAPARPRVEAVPGEPKINRMLRLMVELEASDLHLCTGVVPMVRLHGEMQPLEERGPFSADELEGILGEILPERNRGEFDETNDTDFAHTIPELARFRANYFRDRRGVGGVFRQIPFEILPPEKLGIPPQVLDLCYLTKGLVLVTGPTGSGKSTTLATLIDVINQKRADHIITIEDPIEFVHPNKRCLVNQREVGTHTDGFKKALRAALREDPDIVLVGEMRDLETIAIAIETAETGHLVFGTLHTTTAPSTVDRIIDQFPADRQAQIRTMLSESLKGVIAQVLCKRKGGGRVAAYEVLIANAAVQNLIREGKTYQLVSTMQTGKKQGMQTMNEHLFHHVKNDLVEPMEAYMKSTDKSGFRDMLNRAGIDLKLE